MFVGGVGESGGPPINHPTDLRRLRVKRGGERRRPGLFFKRGAVLYMQAIKLSPRPALVRVP